VPASLGGCATTIWPLAALAPKGSGTGHPQTSLAKFLIFATSSLLSSPPLRAAAYSYAEETISSPSCEGPGASGRLALRACALVVTASSCDACLGVVRSGDSPISPGSSMLITQQRNCGTYVLNSERTHGTFLTVLTRPRTDHRPASACR